MAYSEEEKQNALKRIENGDRIKDIAEETGISVQTLYNWRKANKLVEENQGKDEINKKVIEKDKENLSLKQTNTEENHIEQSIIIKKLIRERRFREAKEIGKRFPNDPEIQCQMMIIATEERDIETVKEIGKRFPNDSRIGFQIASAIMRRNKKRVNTVKKSVKSDKKEKAQLNRIKTQLCYDKIDYSTIETLKKNTDISEFKKVISLLAICEKKKMRSEANRIVREYVTENEQEKKIIKQILAKIASKKANIFDMEKYDAILNWKMDPQLSKQYKDELQEISENRRQERLIARKKAQDIEEKKKTPTERVNMSEKVEEKRRDRSAIYRESLVVKRNTVKIPKEQNKEENVEESSKKQNQMMYNHINKFIKEQRRKLYVNMQSQDAKTQADAITKWDRIEILLDKLNERSQDSGYLESLYNRVLNLESRQGIEL